MKKMATVVMLCFGLCAAGCIGFLLMFESRYHEISGFARWPLFLCSFLSIFMVLLLPRGRRPWIGHFLLGVFVAFFCFVIARHASSGHIPSGRDGASNLAQISKAIWAYQLEYNGYRPFDERGPLQSLSLLYPEWVDDPLVFQNPFISRSWKRRNKGVVFPDGASAAGAICHFGYTWHVPAKAPDSFAIVADMPEFLMLQGDRVGMNVIYWDGAVRWKNSPFCSTNPQDNIFARESGWLMDTDSWIRQK